MLQVSSPITSQWRRNFPSSETSSNDIEAGDHDQQRALRSWVHVMNIIEEGERNIGREAKGREVIDHDFGRSAGVKLVVTQGGRLEYDGRQFVRGDFLWRLVFDAVARTLGDWIDLDQHRPLAELPFFKLAKNAASELSSANEDLIHRVVLIPR